MTYVPLHLHTQYSLLDGAIQIDKLIPHLQKQSITSCAITDHGFLGGLVEFQKACVEADIHPLLGCESYITEDQDYCAQEGKHRDNSHLVILAKDNEGLSQLFRLQSEAGLHNFYYKPRIQRSKLEALSGHAVLTSACLKGIIGASLIFQRDDFGVVRDVVPAYPREFGQMLSWYRDLFPGDFYLEIQDWDDQSHIQSMYNKFILSLARKEDLPVVITTDAHYLTRNDHTLHEVMMAMQLGIPLPTYLEGEVMRYGPHFYVKSPAEMQQSAEKWNIPSAVSNTVEIAEKCNALIELGTYYPPVFNIESATDYQEFLEWEKLHCNIDGSRIS